MVTRHTRLPAASSSTTKPVHSSQPRSQGRLIGGLVNQRSDQAKQFSMLRSVATPVQKVADPDPERCATGRGVWFVQNQDFAIIANEGPPVAVGASIEFSRGLLHFAS
jgi:hypothetical protein